MNNTTRKLSHIKPGKLYQYTGAVFFCVFSEYIKNMNSIIKVCTNDIFVCLSIESREEYDSWNNLYYKKFVSDFYITMRLSTRHLPKLLYLKTISMYGLRL